MTYQYQPLPIIPDSEDIYIRLLELPPGPRFGSIHCSIYEVRLSEAPDFEAVSYCWGPSLDGDTIHVTARDDQPPISDATLTVPDSIIPFLYRTRGHCVPRVRTFWIDSICINQQDPEEKNIQVPKMRDIYLKAESTVSWLGPERDGSTAAFEYARKVYKLYRKHMAKLGHCRLSEEEMKEKSLRVTIGDPDLEALFAVLERPYFERAWIVQEIAVSKHIFLICGDAVVNWETFTVAFCYLILTMQWIWEFYPDHRVQYLLTLKISEMDWETSLDMPWWKILLRHRIHQATDPRDKVYAYYGLRCKDGLHELGIKPDYRNTTKESLFIHLAAKALLAGQTEVLHVPRLVLGVEEANDPTFRAATLPSWVPDWRWTMLTAFAITTGEEEAGKEPKYRAAGDSVFSAAFDISCDAVKECSGSNPSTLPKLLRLRGVRIARITHATASCDYQQLAGRQTLSGQARILQDNQLQIADWEAVLRPKNALAIYPPTGGSRMTAFYETLMAGTRLYTQEHKMTAAVGFERRQRIMRWIPMLRLQNFVLVYYVVVLIERFLRLFGYKNPETLFRTMVGPMLNRRGTRLAHATDPEIEYLALVPSLCRPGDHVVLVEGVRMPLVLRQMEWTSVVGHGPVETWELLGDCYVHGVMDGETWRVDKVDNEERFWWIA
jgi:hypothetical protein